ncbi:skin secretory protein xP2-like [Cricetulus griseus]|uniref:Skin secretory protein xP2-like n=1 Tax=Cricetulus griseus TaxID=10029 RepID=A0A9J7H9Q1_CRIGR|nr:skin secretory protein xP2-like [Cricetulus griseus]
MGAGRPPTPPRPAPGPAPATRPRRAPLPGPRVAAAPGRDRPSRAPAAVVAERVRVGGPGRAARRRGASPCWCPPDLSPPPPAPQRMDGGGGGGASHGLAGLPLMRSAAARGAAGPREAEGAGPGWAAWPAGIRGASGWATRSPGLRPCAETRAAVQRARAGRWPARRHPRRRGPVCAPTQGAPATAESCPPCAPNSSTSEFPGGVSDALAFIWRSEDNRRCHAFNLA